MTTVAVRGGFMAADTQATDGGGIKCTKTQKIFVANDCVIGICGALFDALVFVEWFKDPKKNRKPCLSNEADFLALVLRPDRRVELWTANLVPNEVTEDYYAIGSGGAVAMGAMYCGATAEKAVEAAIKWDGNTGGTVIVAEMRTQITRAKRRR